MTNEVSPKRRPLRTGATAGLPRSAPMRRALRVTVKGLLWLAVLYAGFLALGFVPVNLHYTHPAGEETVTIFVRSNAIHTDLVLPVDAEGADIDWHTLFPPEHFDADIRAAEYVSVGWGDRRFYLETPTWADMKASNVAIALLLPSESVTHVEYLNEQGLANARRLELSLPQYRELINYIRGTMDAPSDEAATPATDYTYGEWDRFYRSPASYHALNTCNQWTGRALKTAGVPVGVWTPLKMQVMCWLPE